MLAQTAVEPTTNAHKTALALLEMMVLKGQVITGDAAFCQRDLCRHIVTREGHYFVKVDDNQPSLKADIDLAFRPGFPPLKATAQEDYHERHTTVDSHGGRVEIRTIETTDRLRGYLDWPGVAPVCRVDMIVRTATETTPNVGYAITSVPPEQADAAMLLRWWRGHWGIENRLHYVRDLAWDEDRDRTRLGPGPQVLAAMRNAAVTLRRSEGVNNITAALRHNAARVRNLLVRLRILTK